MPELYTVILFSGVSLLSAVIGMLVTRMLFGVRVSGDTQGVVFADAPRRYEFREGYLLSQVDPNDAFLRPDVDRSLAYDALARALRAVNGELPARFSALARRGEAFVLPAHFGPDLLSVAGRIEDGRIVVTIGPSALGAGRQTVDAGALAALGDELEDLRRALDGARCPIWRADADGRVLWANAPYLALVERIGAPRATSAPWPIPALFADHIDPLPDAGSLRRCRLPLPPEDPGIATAQDGALWFELAALRQPDGGVLGTALPADRLVGAEMSLRNFVQTLSKTFAQLPIGLAIFDKRRELVLFNPALVGLSMLEPAFLSNRPGLVAFLDALRDRQRMPEPKNYRHWRDEIARLEQGAKDGTFQELWTLPGGQSFRVIGRPHPDGALAFMFEDITAEISLSRKFRAELDLYQSALDDLPEAMAVFSAEGRLVLANTAYGAMWGGDPQSLVGVLSLADATHRWQGCVQPTALWGDIRQFAAPSPDRAAWSEDILLRDGGRLTVRVAPLSGGAVAVSFRPVEDFGLDVLAHMPFAPAARPVLAEQRQFAEPMARFHPQPGEQAE